MKFVILFDRKIKGFYPLNNDIYSISLLKFNNGKTLFQETYNLLRSLTDEKNIYTVTTLNQSDYVKTQLSEVTENPQIISEPLNKNTTTSIACALYFLRDKQDETVIIFPSNFTVESKETLKNTLDEAKVLARKGFIAVLRVKTSIKNSNNLYQNCGIYVAKMSVFLNEIIKYSPNSVNDFSKEMFDEQNTVDIEYYKNLTDTPFDSDIISKTDKTVFVELKTNWKDYSTLEDICNNSEKDSNNNVISKNVTASNVKNSFIYASKGTVIASDIDNKVVIDTDDALIVCDKNRISDLPEISEKVKHSIKETVQIKKDVTKSWGIYKYLNKGNNWFTKALTINQGYKISLQTGDFISKHCIILQGKAVLKYEDNVIELSKGNSINISENIKYSIQNISDFPLKLLEIQVYEKKAENK